MNGLEMPCHHHVVVTCDDFAALTNYDSAVFVYEVRLGNLSKTLVQNVSHALVNIKNLGKLERTTCMPQRLGYTFRFPNRRK